MLIEINLISYERDDVCDSGTSRGCITRTSGVISELGREWTDTVCGTGPAGTCINLDFYTLKVTVGDTGTTVELKLDGSRPTDLEVGDDIVLESWRGRYVTLTNRGHTTNVAGWEHSSWYPSPWDLRSPR